MSDESARNQLTVAENIAVYEWCKEHREELETGALDLPEAAAVASVYLADKIRKDRRITQLVIRRTCRESLGFDPGSTDVSAMEARREVEALAVRVGDIGEEVGEISRRLDTIEASLGM